MRKRFQSNPKLAQSNPTNIQISPDGRYLSYASESKFVRPHICLRTIGQADELSITPLADKIIADHRWSYFPDTLLYTQKTLGKGEHLYALNVKTNIRRCLTPFSTDNAILTPKLLAISPCNRSEILVTLNLDDPHVHDVYRIDLVTGAVVLDTKNPGNVESWIADIALNIRAANSTSEDGSSEIRYRNYRNRTFGEWKTVVSAPAGTNVSAISLSALNDKLYFLSTTSNLTLSAYDVKTEEISVVFDDKENELVTIALNPATQDIDTLFLREKAIFLNSETEAEHELLQTIRNRKFSVLSRTLDNDLLVVSSYSKRGNPKYALFNTKTKQLKTL